MPRLIEDKSATKPLGAFETFVNERDLTFYELSRKSGVSQITLYRIREGLNIRKGTVRKLQKYLRVDRKVILDLLTRDGVIVK